MPDPAEPVSYDTANDLTEARPATEAPAVIHLPDLAPEPVPPPAKRKNGRAVSIKPGSQISRRRCVDDPRSTRIDLRVTPAQKAGITVGAENAGLSVAAFICLRTLGKTPPRAVRRASVEVGELARLRYEQSKRGGNLNQCAKNLNIIGRLAEEGTGCERLAEMVAEMLDLYREAIAEVDRAGKEIERALGPRPVDDD